MLLYRSTIDFCILSMHPHWGLPRQCSGKEFACQCRRLKRFGPRAPDNGVSFLDFIPGCTVFSCCFFFEVSPRPLDHRKLQRKVQHPKMLSQRSWKLYFTCGELPVLWIKTQNKGPLFLKKFWSPNKNGLEVFWDALAQHDHPWTQPAQRSILCPSCLPEGEGK